MAFWKPKYGEPYYFVTPCNCIGSAVYIRHSTLPPNNYYRTFKQAKFALERDIVLEELREYACNFSNKRNMKAKFYIKYDHNRNKIIIQETGDYLGPILYFKNKRNADRAIAKVGISRLIKYYFQQNWEDYTRTTISCDFTGTQIRC